MAARASQRQKDDPYELIYWAGAPGRGEHIRVALEEAGATYTDTGHMGDAGMAQVLECISDKYTGDERSPPSFAPPMLKHGDLIISQTSNILLYLGQQLNLAPDTATDPNGIYIVNQLALTVLDGLSNEAHDTHHPIATSLYYEDQKPESLRRAADYRDARLPKFLAYFERVLSGPASKGGEFLYGGALTYADLVLFQALDGVSFAFPRRVKTLRDSGDYAKVWALYERVKERERIKAYLASDRRQAYSICVYRHYPELDGE